MDIRYHVPSRGRLSQNFEGFDTMSHVARLVHETKLNISDLNKKSQAAQLSRLKSLEF